VGCACQAKPAYPTLPGALLDPFLVAANSLYQPIVGRGGHAQLRAHVSRGARQRFVRAQDRVLAQGEDSSELASSRPFQRAIQNPKRMKSAHLRAVLDENCLFWWTPLGASTLQSKRRAFSSAIM